MGRLALLVPWLARFDPLPVTRDQLILLMAAMNEIFLGVDIFLAHSISGTIVPNEWIPIIFGPATGLLLLAIGLLAQRDRHRANLLASILFLSSIVVGLLGAYFHVRRGILPTGPPGEWVSVELLVWAPPVIGPLTFALVGLIGLSAAWQENPPESGILSLGGEIRLHLPYSKTRALFFMVGLGTLASLISMVFDHARAGFENPWLWISAAVGIFGTAVAVALGAIENPIEWDYRVFAATMLGLIALGITGLSLHVNENLIAEGEIVTERFVRGAPFLAPMLFADMGALGLLALLDPAEKSP
jgi:hypothetical protein